MVAVGLRSKKKRFAIALVALAALLLLLIIIWMRRDPDVNAVLSRAGFAKLPDSAKDVMINRQGDFLYDGRVSFIRFTASQDDVVAFLRDSGIYELGSPYGRDSGRPVIMTKSFAGRLRSMLRRLLRSGPQTITHPSWWIKGSRNPGLLQYRRVPDDPDQTVIFDCVTNTVYIRLYNH